MIAAIRDFYERHFLLWDTIITAVIFVGLLCILHKAGIDVYSNLKCKTDELYKLLVSLGSTVFVFLVTSISILVAFLQSRKFEMLETTTVPTDIVKVFFCAIICSGILTIMALIAWLSWSDRMASFLFYATGMLFILTVIYIARAVWILKHLTVLFLKLKEPHGK